MPDETALVSLLLTEKIETLDAQRDTLICRLKEGGLRKYPLRTLREIILLHSCTVETGALVALAEANVPLLLLSWRGEYAATLQPGPLKNFYPRMAQFDAYRDPARRLETARTIVAAKLAAFRRMTQERDTEHDPTAEDAALSAAADGDALRGVEGAATREHFEEAGEAEGVMLSAEGKKEFFGRWFPFMHEEKRRIPGIVAEVTFREAIFTHVRAFAQWLRGERESWPPR